MFVLRALALLALLSAAAAQTITTPSANLNFTTRVATGTNRVILRLVSHYDVKARTGSTDEGQAEYFVFDESRGRLWVVNSALGVVDIYVLATDGTVVFAENVTLSGIPNSVAYNARDGVIAVAVAGDPQTTGGEIVFLDAGTAAVITTVPTGNPLPDHVSFGPGEGCLYSANEGEPVELAEDVFGGVTQVCSSDFSNDATYVVTSASLSDLVVAGVPAGAHNPSGEPANFTRDMEPEFIAYSKPGSDGAYEVYVICQEANVIVVYAGNAQTSAAIASTPVRIMPLGFKDHSREGNGLDVREDETINIQTYQGVRGIFQPDTIKAVTVGGVTYIITANEGDQGVEEEADGELVDVSAMTFQTGVMSDPLPADLARLDERSVVGAAPYDGLYMNGGRSFSVFNAATGALAFDSGDQMEQMIKRFAPEFFGATDARINRERRSEDKGPEPESLAVGNFEGMDLLFVGLERPGLIGVWDMSDVTAPVFHSLNTVIDSCVTDDRAKMADPEALQFVAAENSPTGKALLIASGSVSSSVSVFEVSGAVVTSDVDLDVCSRAANGDPATAAPTSAAPTAKPTTAKPTSAAPAAPAMQLLLVLLVAIFMAML